VTDRKTALTFEEKITVAFMHYVRGIHQQDLAILYCVNMGRVNEACMTIREALGEPRRHKRHVELEPQLDIVEYLNSTPNGADPGTDTRKEHNH